MISAWRDSSGLIHPNVTERAGFVQLELLYSPINPVNKYSLASSPWQKSALFGVSIVGAVCDRAFFLELTKYGRSQTAPTVGNPSLRLLPRAASSGRWLHRPMNVTS